MKNLLKRFAKVKEQAERVDKLIEEEAEVKNRLVQESRELQAEFNALQNELERFKEA